MGVYDGGKWRIIGFLWELLMILFIVCECGCR